MLRTPSQVTRRSALKAGATAFSAFLVVPSRLFGQDAPSKKFTLGFIGMGSQGTGRNMGTFLHQPDTRILAVCDVRMSSAEKAKRTVDKKYGNKDCTACQDFRDMIGRKDLDVIVISTPDHWHVPLSMAALQAGKDVLCEKPSLTIAEGRTLVNEVTKRKAVFQWGIEDRSLIKYHRLAGWARCGAIGKVKTIHVSLPRKPLFAKEAPAPVPEDLDWNLWLGPAPFRPYTPNRTKPHIWRAITDYSGGSLTDWGAHLMDTAQIAAAMDHSGPVEVSGTCRKLDPEKYPNAAPTEFKLHYRYANGVEIFVVDGQVDIKIVGTDGWVRCNKWNGTWSASNDEILRIKDFSKAKGFWERPEIEHRDFLDSMVSRKPPAYHAEAGHRLSSALHLGHIALRTGKTVTWDPDKEAFKGDSVDCAKDIVYSRPARDWAKA